MKGFSRTLLEVVLVGALSTGLALSANALRARGAIKIGKVYFGDDQTQKESQPRPQASEGSHKVDIAATTPAVVAGDDEAHFEHGFQNITTPEVIEVFNDPLTAEGVYVFVDARDDDHFEEGHIPGALQAYPYELDHYFDDDFKQRLDAALKIIVYCNGGDCEDSKFLCRELVYNKEIPYDNVYLYGGGWRAWSKSGMRIATGRE